MKFLVSTIIGFVMGLVNGLFEPIDQLILQALPTIAEPLVRVASFFGWLVQFVNWALSWLPLSANTWAFIILVLIFRLTVPLVVDSVKLIIKWWHALVP